MPTSKGKNFLYRLALPLLSPSVSACCDVAVTGHEIVNRRKLSAVIRRNHISGAAIYLESENDSSTVFSKAIHTSLVPNETTFFRVASITKMATALLTAVLMDQGILDPHRPVSEMLPDGNSISGLRNIYLHHLLSHTSGIQDPPNLEHLLIARTPFHDVLSSSLRSAPDSVFRYSNLGFGLIGSVLEYVLKETAESVFRHYLFEPLQMNATLEGCHLPEDEIMPVVRMLPYRKDNMIRITQLGRIPLEKPDPALHYGHTAGSMYTDISSLARLVSCIRDGGSPVLTAEYRNYMKEEISHYGKISPTLSYGRGLLLIRDRRISEGTVYGHQGFAYGCVDGAFWEEKTGNMLITLNGGSSELRSGRLGRSNLDFCRWAFRKELAQWK